MKKTVKIYLLLASWASLSVGGLFYLETWSSVPGSAGTPTVHWPKDSHLNLASDALTLVMFVHPRCACTNASITELAKLTAQAGSKIKASIVFANPTNPVDKTKMLNQPEAEKLWRKAVALPSVNVVLDQQDREASLFGSKTSGHVFVFNTQGLRLFDGGITYARGHEGSNEGSEAILSLITEKPEPGYAESAASIWTPIFGCLLKGSKDQQVAATNN